jgi:hypothetical protein
MNVNEISFDEKQNKMILSFIYKLHLTENNREECTKCSQWNDLIKILFLKNLSLIIRNNNNSFFISSLSNIFQIKWFKLESTSFLKHS